jgi:hypothetical protein
MNQVICWVSPKKREKEKERRWISFNNFVSESDRLQTRLIKLAKCLEGIPFALYCLGHISERQISVGTSKVPDILEHPS